MILIGDKLISTDIVKKQFICNLNACKGACCVEGDGGAPLEEEELGILEDNYEEIVPYLTESGKAVLANKGLYTVHSEDGTYATPLINNKACAYVIYNELGIATCGIQQAYLDKKIDFPKPISCHLYPIRITKLPDFDALNYERWDICSPACKLGKEHQVPVYQFLKAPLIRKYGVEFYTALEDAAQQVK